MLWLPGLQQPAGQDRQLPDLFGYFPAASLAGPKPDWILVVSPPILPGLVGAVVKAVRGSKMAYNAQDIFPHAYVRGGSVDEGRLVRERPEERLAMGQAGRKYLETNHSKRGVVDQYAALFGGTLE